MTITTGNKTYQGSQAYSVTHSRACKNIFYVFF